VAERTAAAAEFCGHITLQRKITQFAPCITNIEIHPGPFERQRKHTHAFIVGTLDVDGSHGVPFQATRVEQRHLVLELGAIGAIASIQAPGPREPDHLRHIRLFCARVDGKRDIVGKGACLTGPVKLNVIHLCCEFETTRSIRLPGPELHHRKSLYLDLQSAAFTVLKDQPGIAQLKGIDARAPSIALHR